MGDRVRLTGRGIVATVQIVDGNMLIAVDNDGFEYMFECGQVTVVEEPPAGAIRSFMEASVLTKASGSKDDRNRGMNNIRCQPIGRELIVDLHADALLNERSGVTDVEIHNLQLETIRQTLRSESVRHGRKIVFIHGKGDGVLRQQLIAELKKYPGKLTWHDAPADKYGFQGATKVCIL